MNLDQHGDSEARFAAYVEGLAGVIGHADRARPLHDYCTGLMLPGERKSVEPMAARTAPARTAAQHQSLLHFVGVATWSDEKVLAKVREMVLPAMGSIEAWIIDDTSFPKQGKHSVGVAQHITQPLDVVPEPLLPARHRRPRSAASSRDAWYGVELMTR